MERYFNNTTRHKPKRGRGATSSKSNRIPVNYYLKPPKYKIEESDLTKFEPSPEDYVEDRRPTFSENEFVKERDSLKIIHECLAARRLTLAELLEDVNGEWEGIRSKGESLFGDVGEMVEFMKERSFLFRREKGRFANTSFAYRDGIQLIAEFIINNPDVYGCSLVDLVDYCQKSRNFRVYDTEKKKIDWDDGYMFFNPVYLPHLKEILKEHPEIFEIIDTDQSVSVKLTNLAVNLPCLWEWQALPTKPLVAYSDASRVFKFKAKVVLSTKKGYLAANITEGLFERRSIQIISKEVGMDSLQMHQMFPVGAMVTCRAMFSLNCNCNFTATSIELFDPENPADSEDDEEEEEEEDLFHEEAEKEFEGTSTASEPSIAGDFEIKMDLQLLTRAVKAEKAMIDLVDGILGSKQTYIKDIVEKVLKQKDCPFSLDRDIQEFIEDRPHLYWFEEEKALCLGSGERAKYNAFFNFLAQFGGRGITWEEMINRIKNGEVGSDLQQMAFLGVFEPFVNRVRRLYVKRQLFSPRETIFAPSSTYITKEEILLPNYSLAQFLV